LSRDNPLWVLFGPDPEVQFRADLERDMATVAIIMGLLALGVAVPALVWCRRLSESVAGFKGDASQAEMGERLAELGSESRSLDTRVDHLRQCWQADAGKLESALGHFDARIAELEQGCRSLAAVATDVEGLKNARNEIESALGQLADRMTSLEQGYSGLDLLRQDLEALKEARDKAESALEQWANRTAELEQSQRRLGALAKDLEDLRGFRAHVERVHAGIQEAFNGALTGVSVPDRPNHA